ncbi:chloride channel protein 2-like [Chrysoperla carnea]|uniref:chloride channel protein 2-like n=1 Tax=Chrysoperla carnea TaxID=189513 RepID=UPI001D06534A|nr:chloride channel protein 2-like [Chrysoperla carnea]
MSVTADEPTTSAYNSIKMGVDSGEYRNLGYENTVFGHFQKEKLHANIEHFKFQQQKHLEDVEKQDIVPTKSQTIKQILSKTILHGKVHNALLRMEDWIFLLLVGVIMAFISFGITILTTHLREVRLGLYHHFTNEKIKYCIWILTPLVLIIFSVEFVDKVAPQSIGSGIPEIKTVLRGFRLNRYLTTRALIAKVVGLIGVLGSGMPVGKEGPFVHMACIVATKLKCLIPPKEDQSRFDEDGSRHYDKLIASSAVGVAACYGLPVGGLLFSIEVTTLYFAVRNYWRAFFSASICSALLRLLYFWFGYTSTFLPIFQTYIHQKVPFEPNELFIFATLGLVCGLLGAGYVKLHRMYVDFLRNFIQGYLYRHRFVYPTLVVLLISNVTCPMFFGHWVGSEVLITTQIAVLFLNNSLTSKNLSIEDQQSIETFLPHYHQSEYGIFIALLAVVAYIFIFSIIAGTLPVPSGSFIPGFTMGAAIGRLIGECTYLILIKRKNPVIPAGYAIAGAAAFAGALTHSFSVSVIIIEITGQITHIIPMMLSILIANTTAIFLQPSIYNSIIELKKLPSVPDISTGANPEVYDICVQDFMIKNVKYIWKGMKYWELSEFLSTNHLFGYPFVDSPTTQILLGSIKRTHLVSLVTRRVTTQSKVPKTMKKSRFLKTSKFLKTNYKTITGNDIQKSSRLPSLRQKSPERLNVPPTSLTSINSSLNSIERELFDELNDTNIIDDVNKYDEDLKEYIDWYYKDTTHNDFEKKRLYGVVDFRRCQIDPSPFQLVERTSLLKVQTIFSMLAIRTAYVTNMGRLVGVVSLTDLCQAIDDVNHGKLTKSTERNRIFL